MKYDIVVIGGGPAGLAAAIEAKKIGVKKILVIERDKELGGILQQCIHNGFGLHIFQEELTGPEYAHRFIEELKHMKIEYKLDTIVLDMENKKNITAMNSSEGIIHIEAKAVVLAMGCRERTRGAIRIPGKRPAGVYTAGMAQRFVNIEGYMPGKKVVILGSGDIGLIMARRMKLEGAEVLAVAELKEYSGGLTRNIVQCLDDYNIPLYLEHTVVNIEGKNRVEAVTIAKVDKGFKPIKGTERRIECDTLLLSVGLIPENELSKSAQIHLDSTTGGPVVNENMETSVSGIFACGNVVHVHDLVDWVTEESRKAGESAAKHIQGRLSKKREAIETKPKDGISYIVPQKVSFDFLEKTMDKKLGIKFRVTKQDRDVEFVIKSGNKIIKRKRKKHVAPGEMETIYISREEMELVSKEISLEMFGGDIDA